MQLPASLKFWQQQEKPPRNPHEDDEGVVKRDLVGWAAKIAVTAGVLWGIFHLAAAAQLFFMPPAKLRAIHLGFALFICFILAPFGRKSPMDRPSVSDWLLAVGSAVTLALTAWRYDTLVTMGGRYHTIDIVLGIIGILVLFEASRRVVSPGLVLFTAGLVAYGYYGEYFPDAFQHAGFSVNRLVQHLYLSGEGVFGFVLGVSAEIIVVFVIFGSVLQEVRVADFFYEFANAIAGGLRGGAAKVGIISSSMMGMVSGETSSNVATTGAFNIPLMKRAGYQPEFSGAVEVAAACGGQIMPPVMGATAFVIADALGMPYGQLALAALIPALMYYVGVYAQVHFRAVKLDLRGLSKEDLPRLLDVLKRKGYMLLPILGIVALLISKYTPTFAAFWGGIVVAIAITAFKKDTRLDLNRAVIILARASRTAMVLAVTCALVGIIVGIFSLTGITLTLADIIFKMAGGNTFVILALTAVVALILGLGLPTTATYVLTAISAAPVLLKLGVTPFVSHMFVFYFGVLSALTPPVATGAFTAAALAGADPDRTGWQSLKLALSGFVAPFLFIYDPRLLPLSLGAYAAAIEPFLRACLGLTAISAAIEGAWLVRCGWPVRIAFAVGGLLTALPGTSLTFAGLALLIAAFAYHYLIERPAARRAGTPAKTV